MTTKKRILLILGVVVIIAVLAGIGVKSRFETNLQKLAAVEIADADLAKARDGIYTGKFNMFPVGAEVKVTVKDRKITGIELVKHNNGKGSAAEVMPERVLSAQALSVDIVSGATYSSKAILKAIEIALLEAVSN